MRDVYLALLITAVVSITAGSAAAANYTQETLDRYLRIDYQVEPNAAQPVVSGYVYNMPPGAASRSHAARYRRPRCLRQGRWVLVDLDTRRCTNQQSRLLHRAGRAGCLVSGPGALPRLGQVRRLGHGQPGEPGAGTPGQEVDRVTPPPTASRATSLSLLNCFDSSPGVADRGNARNGLG